MQSGEMSSVTSASAPESRAPVVEAPASEMDALLLGRTRTVRLLIPDFLQYQNRTLMPGIIEIEEANAIKD
ncbi:hypothetical protein AVEN_234497-1 [Araneus ventricosus]|uniref:Uncharacterized protein n=1 Tax=Araneus ventricosus TaxID=182803 RepID=A0A4Y2A8P0_ARAVE|nr:hypothetical protein AVEN_234497-1 [Araneus ventricosus]